MRTMAMVLAIAYVVGASLLFPGARSQQIDRQISVPLAGAATPSIAVPEKTP
ncbi:MAG TPA: hypothetical protein VN809_05210 [Telmatospirillum sp.]|nr:hypothetical protein [Telmatospirillum sp.]